jgi:iron complex outermembrane receptor protein
VSQAVTAITEQELERKNVSSFVDLSAIAPGVTVANNEGFKTVISIRGVGNETNQNTTANPSVSFHVDGIYVASPYALSTDFTDVKHIEVLWSPQGTLFGQNSTGDAISVMSKKPDFEEFSGNMDATIGTDNLTKSRCAINVLFTNTLAMRTFFFGLS